MTEPKRDKILAMIAEGHSNEDIIAALGSSRKYVARLRWERNHKGKQPIPQPTYAIPRPCGPFEELALKARARQMAQQAIVRELMFPRVP